jgi:peptidoglycan DL-endopeptidase CwlO
VIDTGSGSRRANTPQTSAPAFSNTDFCRLESLKSKFFPQRIRIRSANLIALAVLLLAASSGRPDEASPHRHTKTPANGKSSTSHRHHRSPSTQKDDTAPSPTPDAKKTNPSPGEAEEKGPPAPANVASLDPENLREFDKQPSKVQELIRNALALTKQNLTYKYGSSNPSEGGMDCSGFIYYVLTQAGFKDVPRDSSGQYTWIRQESDFHAVLSRNSQSFEFKDLKLGDLMFWSGTYKVNRETPISHVMIYLGTEKSTGKPVMVGSSDGRSYGGVSRNGVSVFDFKLPSGEPKTDEPELVARFEGYGTIPGLREASPGSEPKHGPESAPQSNINPTPTPRKEPLGNGD